MTTKQILTLLAFFCALPGTPANTIADEEVVDDDGGVRCIDTRRISSTTVADNQNIIFYMRGGEIYRNTLPRACPSLAREERFSYRTTISRLCDLDTITVLYSMGGGLQSGPSCGLGKFYPISEEEAQALKAGPDAEIEAEPVPPAEPEEPAVENAEEEAGN
jgi:hypothetical protein